VSGTNATTRRPNEFGGCSAGRRRWQRLQRAKPLRWGCPLGAGAAVVRQNVAAFMAWWRKCDVEGWAAWDNAIVAGAGASKVPTQAFEYWNQRKNIRSVVNPATGALAAVFGSIRPSTFVAPPPPPAPPGSSMVFIPPTPSGSSSLLIDSPAGATRSSSSFGPAMSGLGQVSTNLSELAPESCCTESGSTSATWGAACLARATRRRAQSNRGEDGCTAPSRCTAAPGRTRYAAGGKCRCFFARARRAKS